MDEVSKLVKTSIFTFMLKAKFYIYFHYFLKHEQTYNEIKYWANRCNLSIGSGTLLNYFYDVVSAIASATMCSSAVIYDKDFNAILVSNMDFWFHHLLYKVIYKANNYKDNKLVYTSLNILGLFGPIRFYSHKGNYAMTMNQRLIGSGLYFFIEMYYNMAKTPQVFMHELAMNAESFEEAYNLIHNTELLSPVYYALIGRDKNNVPTGLIIEHSKDHIHDEYW